MFLHNKQSDTLVEILDIEKLINPSENSISAKVQDGQEEQDPAPIAKQDLVFPSGESLPRCWLDANYREGDSLGNR